MKQGGVKKEWNDSLMKRADAKFKSVKETEISHKLYKSREWHLENSCGDINGKHASLELILQKCPNAAKKNNNKQAQME